LIRLTGASFSRLTVRRDADHVDVGNAPPPPLAHQPPVGCCLNSDGRRRVHVQPRLDFTALSHRRGALRLTGVAGRVDP
jgi:hypothetical protein